MCGGIVHQEQLVPGPTDTHSERVRYACVDDADPVATWRHLVDTVSAATIDIDIAVPVQGESSGISQLLSVGEDYLAVKPVTIDSAAEMAGLVDPGPGDVHCYMVMIRELDLPPLLVRTDVILLFSTQCNQTEPSLPSHRQLCVACP